MPLRSLPARLATAAVLVACATIGLAGTAHADDFQVNQQTANRSSDLPGSLLLWGKDGIILG